MLRMVQERDGSARGQFFELDRHHLTLLARVQIGWQLQGRRRRPRPGTFLKVRRDLATLRRERHQADEARARVSL